MNDQLIPDAVSVLERATGDHPVAVDDFARDQTAAHHVTELDPERFGHYLETLTLQESELVLERLYAIRAAHRDRADRIDRLEDNLRQRIRDAAEYGNHPLPAVAVRSASA